MVIPLSPSNRSLCLHAEIKVAQSFYVMFGLLMSVNTLLIIVAHSFAI